MNEITSNQNTTIKEVKSLKEKKHREEKRLFFIEGTRFVEEALKENAQLAKVFISDKFYEIKGGRDLLNQVSKSGFETYLLPEKLFKEISDTENPQGILAVVKMAGYELNDILNKDGFVVILDSVQDPGNMGTIIRTADAAGALGIILSRGCVDLYNPKVLRSTMGSIFHIPFYISGNLVETIHSLKLKGYKVIAAHLEGDAFYYHTDMTGKIAMIIGNEANGIGMEVAGCADMLIKIPIEGRAESLNASVAAGILMYEAVRQKTCK